MMRPMTWTIAALALSFLCGAAEADEFDPGKSLRAEVTLVERDYLASPPVDDSLSQKWFATFLARLEPRRMYFLQSDLRDFAPFEKRLDDLARDGNFEFASLVRKCFRQRVIESGYMSPTSFDSLATQITIRSYELGVWFEEKEGRLLLSKSSWRKVPAASHVLEEFELIAFRRLEGRVLDVVEMPIDEVNRSIRWVGYSLADEKVVFLELMKTQTVERLTARCPRSQVRH